MLITRGSSLRSRTVKGMVVERGMGWDMGMVYFSRHLIFTVKAAHYFKTSRTLTKTKVSCSKSLSRTQSNPNPIITSSRRAYHQSLSPVSHLELLEREW